LTGAVKNTTACICYFGGDPSPQIPMLLEVSREAIEENSDRILRICWETNGSMSRPYLEEMAQTTLSSGGCIKIDLKALNETLHIALTGVTNKQTFENFAWLTEMIPLRPEPPFLIASTLMVPGYIDEHEIKHIAEFIAKLNPELPYSLLAFHPQYKMSDLPATTRKQADACLRAASKAGLKRIKVGNTHLLW
jgi:pyruvate formate lyase activating enzyme